MLKRDLHSTRTPKLASPALLGLVTLSLIFVLTLVGPILAQTSPVPYFWDPQVRLERPDLAGVQELRLLTDDDYPPFGVTTAEGKLSGFNVDLARAICEELKLTCRIQVRRWDKIIEALNTKEGDAIIASLAIRPANRKLVDFTSPYYRTPARFLALRDSQINPDQSGALANKRIGVIGQTAHEAYLRKFFKTVQPQLYSDQAGLVAGLQNREVDLIFGDGVSLAIWLNQQIAPMCCELIGGPYTESTYFGEGVGIAVRKQSPQLLQALNYALQRIAERGIYADLYLKYFPIGFY
jgi:polar amino acid transport system substrate-binding protein